MKRFISLPNVSIQWYDNGKIDTYNYFQIDTKNITHYQLKDNIFEITLSDSDGEYFVIKSDWNKHPILSILMEMKFLRIMNYWNKHNA